MEKPIFILGAGATKACSGPLTDEILPAALNGKIEGARVQDREELLSLTREFLGNCFGVPVSQFPVRKEDCPSLPLVLSMVRRSVELSQPLGDWRGDRLIAAKRAIEYSIFAVIEAALQKIPRDRQYHYDLLEPLYQRGIEPVVVSLNYDLIVDNSMFILSERFKGCPPDYGVRISTERYQQFCQGGVFGHLLKIHGSLNWLYCEKCKRLDLLVTEGMRTSKALDELYNSLQFGEAYSCQGTPCRNRLACDGFVSPILITPTYVKDYENRHIETVWASAETQMKDSDRAVIIGYSLPTDDVEVAMLFKRGLGHLPKSRITVIEYIEGDLERPVVERLPIDKHPTGQRFRSIFGTGIDWQTTGFGGWLSEQKKGNKFPYSP